MPPKRTQQAKAAKEETVTAAKKPKTATKMTDIEKDLEVIAQGSNANDEVTSSSQDSKTTKKVAAKGAEGDTVIEKAAPKRKAAAPKAEKAAPSKAKAKNGKAVPAKEPAAKTARGRKAKAEPETDEEETPVEEPVAAPAAKKTRGRKAKATEENDPEEPEVIPVKKVRGKKAQTEEIASEDGSGDSKENGEVSANVTTRVGRATKKTEESAAPKKKGGRKPKQVEAVDEQNGEDEPAANGEEEESKAAPSKAKATKKAATKVTKGEPKEKKTKATAATANKTPNPTGTNWSEVSFDCTAANKFGQEANIRITSWNVDGLRAWVKKGGLAILEEAKSDVLCLQETKCSEEKLPEEVTNVDGYKMYWCGSEKEGYAGVGVLTKIEPINVTNGIGDTAQDSQGRCITVEYDKFYLINVYVPNAGRGLVTLDYRLEWNRLFASYVKRLDEIKPVIVCGDMNVAHSEIDLTNPKTNQKNAGFTPQERQGMTEFLTEGAYVDTFRHLYADVKDAYTFWSYMSNARAKNIGWRLDYFIVSDRIKDNVCDNVIHSKVLGSDHCPLTLYFNL